MNDFLKKLLKSLGVTDAQIATLEAYDTMSDEDKAKHPQKTFVDSVQEHVTGLLENDQAFTSRFAKAAEGKILEQVDRRLKQNFGLTADQIKEKSIEEKMTLAKTTLETQYKKTGDTLQDENATLTAKIKTLEEVEIPAIKSQVDTEKENLHIDVALNAMLADPDLRLKVSPGVIMPGLKGFLGGKYKSAVNDKRELEIVDKATGLKVKNEDGTGFLSAKDVIKSYLTDNKAIEQSNADPEKKVVVKVTGTEEPAPVKKSTMPGMSEAEKNLAALEKITGEKK